MSNKKDPVNNDLINKLSFCVFDLETTGGNHDTDRIIEIGMVKITNMQIVDEKTFLIRPDVAIPEFIQKLTTITPQDVKNSPRIEEIIDLILEFMGDSILVAHNTSFDIPFFNAVLKRIGHQPLKNPSLCTNLMTKYMIPNLLNTNLNYMSKIFRIKHRKAHRALDDARATAELLLTYLKIYKDKGITKINGLYYPRNRFELDRANIKNENDAENRLLQKLSELKSPFVLTLKGESGVILYAQPATSTATELKFIKKALQSTSWLSATIKLYGTSLETLINFTSTFTKLSPETRKQVLSLLQEVYLKNKNPLDELGVKELTDKNLEKIVSEKIGDFILMHHLVPDQLLVLPITYLHPKAELIFRYPGHQKKFLQYVNARVTRWMQPGGPRPSYPIGYKIFLYNFILSKSSEYEEFFNFKKSLVKKDNDQFFKELDHFINNNPNLNSYPSDYL
jgi:DNA polymerase-3 subunit epsilon